MIAVVRIPSDANIGLVGMKTGDEKRVVIDFIAVDRRIPPNHIGQGSVMDFLDELRGIDIFVLKVEAIPITKPGELVYEDR